MAIASKTYTVQQMEVYWADGAIDSSSTKSGSVIDRAYSVKQ